MFQVFHLNVVKVYLRCYICCNGNIRILQAYVLIISDIYFKCFIWMFQKLIWRCTRCNGYTCMFQVFLYVFRRMLQIFYRDVLKVDLVLQAVVSLLVVVRRCSSHAGD